MLIRLNSPSMQYLLDQFDQERCTTQRRGRMPNRYMMDGSEGGSVLWIFLVFGAIWLIGKALAALNILTVKNSTTMAKIIGVVGGIAYAVAMADASPVKDPPWWMLVASAAFYGALIFALTWGAFAVAAKEEKKDKAD